MCNPVGMAVGAAGSAVGGLAQKGLLNQQNQSALQGINAQGVLQRQGNADVTGLTNTIANSNQNTQNAIQGQLGSYNAALAKMSPQTQAAQPSVAGASGAFKADRARAGGSAQDYVNAIKNSAATTQGTQLERVGEGQQMAGTASNLGLLNTQSQQQNYLTQLQIRAAQANPWLTALSSVMKGAGAAMGLGGGADSTISVDADVGDAINAQTSAFGGMADAALQGIGG